MSPNVVGKLYGETVYGVGREKIREYALAVGETQPLYLDLQVARATGCADLIAPPMFAAVYARTAMEQALYDPDFGLDLSRVVHGAQEFEWDKLVIAGEDISTTVWVKEIVQKGSIGFYVIETVSRNDRSERVCRGTWTIISRDTDGNDRLL